MWCKCLVLFCISYCSSEVCVTGVWTCCNAGFFTFVFEVQVVREKIEALVKRFVVYDAAILWELKLMSQQTFWNVAHLCFTFCAMLWPCSFVHTHTKTSTKFTGKALEVWPWRALRKSSRFHNPNRENFSCFENVQTRSSKTTPLKNPTMFCTDIMVAIALA